MVSGHEHHLPGSQRPGQLLEQRPGDLERGGERSLAQLEDVAEQHESVGAVHDLSEARPHLWSASHVVAGPQAEVQVGDDDGAHGRDLGSPRLAGG